MKQSKLISMVLITLMVCGWALALLKDDSAENEEYLRHVEMAEEYVQRGLYQKSIEEYDSALAIRNTEDVWKCKLDSYERCYEENKKIYNDYLNAAQTAVSYYSSNVEYLITLANLYITRNEYLAAYKALEKAINNGMDDVSVNELLFDVTYAYDPTNMWLKRHQMSLNSKLDDFTIKDFIECGKKMNISKIRSEKIIDEVRKTITDWRIYAEKAHINERIYEEIKRNHRII